MESILIKALQLILCLSIIVIVHEFGHFFFARLFKIRVEKFYLFFNPWFSLFKYKPKNSDTEYGLGWLPLGGYVKISGMIDESMDKEQMAQEPQPWEFRSKPSWQRLLVMIGGVLFNFILAFFIYSMILFSWGDSYVPLKNQTHGMAFSQVAKDAGFQDGDVFLKADGLELERMTEETLFNIVEAQHVTVLRNGKEADVAMPESFMLSLLGSGERFYTPMASTKIGKLEEDGSAAKAGLLVNDSITSIDGIAVAYNNELMQALEGKENKTVQVTYIREGKEQTTPIALGEEAKLGVYAQLFNYEPVVIKYGFFESFPAGIKLGVSTLKSYVVQFKYVFTKEGASSLGGFGTLGSIFPDTWNWRAFWMMTAFISVALGFMNILPIPALDGGHVMFLFYEMIAGRKPNEKFMEYAQILGMAFLLLLVLYANGNDIIRAFF